MNKEVIAKMKEYLMIEYILSGESERIDNPIKIESKYEKYLMMLERCMKLGLIYGLKINYTDPDFPQDIHMIEIILFTENEEIEIDINNIELLNLFTMSEGLIIDTDLKGNIRIDLFVENIYKSR